MFKTLKINELKSIMACVGSSLQKKEVRGESITELYLSNIDIGDYKASLKVVVNINSPENNSLVLHIPGVCNERGVYNLHGQKLNCAFFEDILFVEKVSASKSEEVDLNVETLNYIKLFNCAISALIDLGFKPDKLLGVDRGGIYSILLGSINKSILGIYVCLKNKDVCNTLIKNDKQYTITLTKDLGIDLLYCLRELTPFFYLQYLPHTSCFTIDESMNLWNNSKNKLLLFVNGLLSHPTNTVLENQPYLIENIVKANMLGKVMSIRNMRLTWEAGGDYVTCWPINEDEKYGYKLLTKEHGGSEEYLKYAWNVKTPAYYLEGALVFKLSPINVNSTIYYYIQKDYLIDNLNVSLTTPIYSAKPIDRGLHKICIAE